MDIHKAIMNIHNSIKDIYNCIMGTHNYTLKLLYFQLLTLNAIMDMHVWIMDIHNWIMDVHNQILYIYNSRILWIASHVWIEDIHDWLCTYISRGFICFWISIVDKLSYFQPIASMALNHACHDITALLRHNRFHKIYTIAGPRGRKKGRDFLAPGFIWIIITYHCDLLIVIIKQDSPVTTQCELILLAEMTCS